MKKVKIILSGLIIMMMAFTVLLSLSQLTLADNDCAAVAPSGSPESSIDNTPEMEILHNSPEMIEIEVDCWHLGHCQICDEYANYDCSPYGSYGGYSEFNYGIDDGWEPCPFSDPIPSGNIVTKVEATIQGAGCQSSYGGSMYTKVLLNDQLIDGGTQAGNCACGTCFPLTVASAEYVGGFPGYVYDGSNQLSLEIDGVTCFSDVHLKLYYSPAEPGVEKSFTDTTLFETLLAQDAVLNNVTVSGDFTSTLDFTNFELVSITTGSFAGKGFSKGGCQTTLGGIPYTGNWQGALFFKPLEGKIYLKGAISGEISATVEGYLTETVPGSGTYDQYQATWRIGRLGGTITSATINLAGTLSYQSSSEFPTAELYILQTNLEGNVYGDYSGPLSTVLTHLRVVEETNPYSGEGFSIISYSSESGSGEGWTYDNLVSPGRVRLKGLFNSPLFGIVTATLDESSLPRTLFANIERVDLGLPPAPDLKVETWGPTRVSPGQTINYSIEYRNDGLQTAEDVMIVCKLPYEVEYISSTTGGSYTVASHGVMWHLGDIPPKSSGLMSVTVKILWGLPEGTSFENMVSIPSAEIEVEVDPSVTLDVQILDASEEHLHAIFNICDQSDSGTIYLDASFTNVPEPIEPTFVYIETVDSAKAIASFTVEGSILAYSIVVGGILLAKRLSDWSEDMEDFTKAMVERKAFLNWLKTENRISEGHLTNNLKANVGAYWVRGLVSLVSIPGAEVEGIQKFIAKELVFLDLLAGKTICEHAGETFSPKWNESPLEVGKAMAAYRAAHKSYSEGTSEALDSFLNFIAVARDPNIKYGPEGNVLPGQQLDYKVEYENEGEGIAFGVYFTDILDEDLDDATLEIGPVIDVETGDQIAPPGIYNLSTRTITWFVGEVGPGDGGYANFSVNIRGDAPEGTEVINYATVYFPSVPEITRTNAVVSVIPTNRPPIANAGPDQTIQCTSPDGAQVTLDGTGSSDPDNDPLTFTWCENGTIIAGPTTDPISTVTLALGTHTIELTVDDGQGETDSDEVVINVVGAICGDVTHDNGNPVANVTVKVIDSDNNQVGDPIVTGADGSFYFDLLPVGTYSVMIVTPLGYSVSPGETQTGIEVTDCPCTEVYFVLTPTITSNDCRTIGYWKHQFDVYLSGGGHAQEDSADLEQYLDLVHLHFDVLGIYTDLENFDFVDAKNVLTVSGGQLMEDRAKQQLFGLLLNFASGRIGNETVVSEDSRVAAEAVTYAAILISDGDPANDELAKTICDLINNGQMVEAAIIAESPERYRVAGHDGIPKEYTLNQNYPNPFNPVTQISFALPRGGHVKLEIYNLLGQKVATLVDEYQEAGQKTMDWEAKNLASGIYFYKLSSGDFTATKKMVLTK